VAGSSNLPQSIQVVGQFDGGEPEFLDGLHHFDEVPEIHRLGDGAIGV